MLCLAAIGALIVLNACLVVALCRRRRKRREGHADRAADAALPPKS